MTHHTDTERAEFEAWYIAGARKSVPAFAEWSEIELREGCMRPDSGSYRIDYARIAWDAWQAARRAPSVPVPQGWTDQLEQVLCDLQVGPYPSIALAVKRIEGLLAAAPQPPEAAQLDDTNVADMAQAVDSKEAAPVQLPEHVYTLRIRGRLHDHTPALPAFDLEDGEHKLYTEQQVRQLLAAHSIQEQST